MSDHKFLHLPVKDTDGTVLGLVDVMELVCTTAGGEGGKGWRDFFKGALEARGDQDDKSDTTSERSTSILPPSSFPYKDKSHSYMKSSPRQRSPSDPFSDLTLMVTEYMFKIVDTEGHIHRLKSSIESLHILKSNIWSKFSSTETFLSDYNNETHDIILKYIDDEKDEIIISSDSALKEAVEFARNTGISTLKLDIKFVAKKTSNDKSLSATKAAMSSKANATNSSVTAAGDSSKSSEVTTAAVTDQKRVLIGGGVAIAATAVIALVGYAFVRNRK